MAEKQTKPTKNILNDKSSITDKLGNMPQPKGKDNDLYQTGSLDTAYLMMPLELSYGNQGQTGIAYMIMPLSHDYLQDLQQYLGGSCQGGKTPMDNYKPADQGYKQPQNSYK